MTRKYKRVTKQELKNIKSYCDLGFTTLEIAEKLNTSTTSIRYIKSKYNCRRKSSINKNSILAITNLTECEKSYIAGIIDGEGSILIFQRNTSLNSGEINPLFTVCIKISNTDYTLIEWLHQRLGGKISFRKGIDNRRNQFTLILNQSLSIKLLELIYEYLVIKQEQAKLVFELRETYNVLYQPTPSDIVDIRCRLCLQLKQLHKLGFTEDGQRIQF